MNLPKGKENRVGSIIQVIDTDEPKEKSYISEINKLNQDIASIKNRAKIM